MTTTDPSQEQPEPDQPIHVGGAIPAAEGAAPPPDLASLDARLTAVEARLDAVENTSKKK